MNVSQNHTRRSLWFELLLVAVAIFLTALTVKSSTFFAPNTRDSGIFDYFGYRILQGDVPYRDVWDIKTPLIFYYNAFAQSLFGSNMQAIRYFEVFYSSLNAFVLFLILRQRFGRPTSIIMSLLFTFISCSQRMTDLGNYTETYMLLPVLLAVYFFLKEKWVANNWSTFGIGCLLGASFLTKQPASFDALAIGIGILAIYTRKESFPQAFVRGVILFVGFLSSLASAAFFFFLNDSLPQFIESAFTMNVHYINGGWNWETSRQYAADYLVEVSRTLSPLILLIATIPLTSVVTRKADGFGFAWLWVVLDLIGVSLSGHYFRHYFIQLLPPLIYLSSYALEGLFAWLREQSSKRWIAGLLLIAFLAVFFLVPFAEQQKLSSDLKRSLSEGYKSRNQLASEYLTQKANPQDVLFEYAGVYDIYYLTKLPAPPTPYLMKFAFMPTYFGTYNDPKKQEFTNILKSSNITWFVVDLNDRFIDRDVHDEMQLLLPELHEYLLQNFTKQTTIENIEIWKRN